MHRLTAIELREQVRKGERSAEEVARYFLQRIAQHDGDVGAFLSVLEERVISQARAIDAKRARGESLGLLAGVPVAVKDNMHIEGEKTTCASRFLDNYRAPFWSTAVRLLEEQDALLIGKTNLDEFAMGSTTTLSAFHPTHNPWCLDCVSGGSSGGSAAAVAARMALIATGSDTGGSVRQPASLCGVVGFKPSYGRVSRFGLVAFGSSLDQIGPFAANVSDAALAMQIMGQHDPHDGTSLSLPPDDYFAHLDKGIQGWKVGVPWKFLETLQDPVHSVFKSSIKSLESLGAELVDIDLDILEHSVSVYYILAPAEASTNLSRFDGIRYGRRSTEAKTLDEVYDLSREEGFGYEVKKRIMLGTFVLSTGYQDAYYKKAQRVRRVVIEKYQKAFERCDIVAMPVSPGVAFPLADQCEGLEIYLQDLYTISCNLAGLPGISVPAGFSLEGKPIGLQLIGPQKHDVQVTRAAFAFEKAAKCSDRIPDRFQGKE